MLRRPKDVATDLGVSAPTLRLWSALFASQLSDHARKALPGGGPTAQRRYDDNDVAVLTEVRSLLRQGLTFDEVAIRLNSRSPIRQLPERTRQRLQPDSEPPTPAAPEPAPSRFSPTDQISAKDQTIAALQEALSAKEATLRALEDALAAKDKTIDALKDSLKFFNAYLQALGEMRSGGQQQPPSPPQQDWDDLNAQDDQGEAGDLESAKPKWRRLLGLQ